jgi:hypothetical protein
VFLDNLTGRKHDLSFNVDPGGSQGCGGYAQNVCSSVRRVGYRQASSDGAYSKRAGVHNGTVSTLYIMRARTARIH